MYIYDVACVCGGVCVCGGGGGGGGGALYSRRYSEKCIGVGVQTIFFPLMNLIKNITKNISTILNIPVYSKYRPWLFSKMGEANKKNQHIHDLNWNRKYQNIYDKSSTKSLIAIQK